MKNTPMPAPDTHDDPVDLAVAPSVDRHILVRTPLQTATIFVRRFRWLIAAILIAVVALVVSLSTGGPPPPGPAGPPHQLSVARSAGAANAMLVKVVHSTDLRAP